MKSNSATLRQLKHALRCNLIVPWYQPIVDKSGHMTGVEVLARWIRRDGTQISPDVFIPMAMRANLITALTRSLMVRTARELSPCASWLPQPFKIAFNMPAACLEDGALPAYCRTFLSAFPPTVLLTLEVTERDTSQSLYRVADTLNALIESGVEVALDDFGTGYANLNMLCWLPLTTVKLDRMFCTGSPGTTEALIAANIMKLARGLGLHVLAEGVETLAQVKLMATFGAEAFQGYFFSPPVPLRKLIWLALPGALTPRGVNKKY